ncbi:MAG: PA14 domain-containing protein [Pseudomonadota bacterium]
MKMLKTTALAAAALMVAGAALAAPLKLTPASPQPSGLTSGLSVQYTYPLDVKTLKQAKRYLKESKPGTPLKGLDYRDTAQGEKALTSKQAEHVVAGIKGYVKFDSAGTYMIQFLTNDGLDARIGGQEVGYFDGRQACQETRAVEVEVPQAGWYPLDITYFQRVGTSCLLMKAGQGGMKWMPDSAFGY